MAGMIHRVPALTLSRPVVMVSRVLECSKYGVVSTVVHGVGGEGKIEILVGQENRTKNPENVARRREKEWKKGLEWLSRIQDARRLSYRPECLTAFSDRWTGPVERKPSAGVLLYIYRDNMDLHLIHSSIV